MPASRPLARSFRACLAWCNKGRGPLLRSTEEVGIAALKTKATPWSFEDNTEQVDEIRALFPKALGVTDEHQVQRLKRNIALVPSTSYAMTLVARSISIQPGHKVVVLHGQMSSNVMPWQQVCQENSAELQVVTLDAAASRSDTWADAVLRALKKQAQRVAAVALPNFLWSDGSLVDLQPIADFCDSVRIPCHERTVFLLLTHLISSSHSSILLPTAAGVGLSFRSTLFHLCWMSRRVAALFPSIFRH